LISTRVSRPSAVPDAPTAVTDTVEPAHERLRVPAEREGHAHARRPAALDVDRVLSDAPVEHGAEPLRVDVRQQRLVELLEHPPRATSPAH
jgi:hypothetical protein